MFGYLSLLSRIRLGPKEVDVGALARRQYMLPITGFVIGSIVSIVALLIFEIPGDTTGIMLESLGIILFLYLLTGLIHLEGLADFGDGLMASGTQERKRQAMKDVSLGAAGVFFLVAALLSLFILVTHLDGWVGSPALTLLFDRIPLVWGLILAEMSAKLAMMTVMSIGPSSHQGMGSAFVSAASPGKLLAGIMMAVLIAFALCGIYCITVLLGLVAGIIVAVEARRHFGGVGGDSFGAANEFGRILALLAWVVLL